MKGRRRSDAPSKLLLLLIAEFGVEPLLLLPQFGGVTARLGEHDRLENVSFRVTLWHFLRGHRWYPFQEDLAPDPIIAPYLEK